MQKVSFGDTGLQVTPLGLGAVQIGEEGRDPKQVHELLNTLLDRGINLIDTAAVYNHAERLIGEAIGHRRDEYVLVTKGGTCVGEMTGVDWSGQAFTDSIERSLRLLRTDHLDVMFIHSAERDVLEKGEAMAAVVRAKEAGKVRFIGYSGDNETGVYGASLPEVEVFETSINICDQTNIDDILPITRRRNLGVLAKRPIANGPWRPRGEQRKSNLEYGEIYAKRFKAMGLKPEELGFDDENDWGEIALRFTLAQPGVHTSIIGTASKAHLEKNIEAAEKGPLPEAAVAKIREVFRKTEKKLGETWNAET